MLKKDSRKIQRHSPLIKVGVDPGFSINFTLPQANNQILILW